MSFLMTGITLRVLDGADRGRVFNELTPPVTVGREEGNTIQLIDERVSRFHLKIQEDQDKIVLTDLESSNGTKVNGEDIQLRILRFGDMITIGRSVLLFGSRDQIANRLAEMRRKDASLRGTIEPSAAAKEGRSSSLDFDLNLNGEDGVIHTLEPPDLPEGMTAGQFLVWLSIGSSTMLASYRSGTAPDLDNMARVTFQALLIGDSIPKNQVLWLMLLPVALIAAGSLFMLRRNPWALFWLLAMIVVPFTMLYFITRARRLYEPRYLIMMMPALYILAASGLAGLASRRRWRVAAVVGASAWLIIAVYAYGQAQFNPRFAKSPDWRARAAYLEANQQPGDVIVHNYPDPSFAYYYRGAAPFRLIPTGYLDDQRRAETLSDLQGSCFADRACHSSFTYFFGGFFRHSGRNSNSMAPFSPRKKSRASTWMQKWKTARNLNITSGNLRGWSDAVRIVLFPWVMKRSPQVTSAYHFTMGSGGWRI